MWSKQHLTRSPSLHLQRVLVLDHLVLELSHLFTCSLLISCVFLHTSFCRISVFSLLDMFSYALRFSLSFSVFLEDFPLSFLFLLSVFHSQNQIVSHLYILCFFLHSLSLSQFLRLPLFPQPCRATSFFESVFTPEQNKTKKTHAQKHTKKKERKHTYIHTYIYLNVTN